MIGCLLRRCAGCARTGKFPAGCKRLKQPLRAALPAAASCPLTSVLLRTCCSRSVRSCNCCRLLCWVCERAEEKSLDRSASSLRALTCLAAQVASSNLCGMDRGRRVGVSSREGNNSRTGQFCACFRAETPSAFQPCPNSGTVLLMPANCWRGLSPHLSLAFDSPCSMLCCCSTSLVRAARSAAALRQVALLSAPCCCCWCCPGSCRSGTAC